MFFMRKYEMLGFFNIIFISAALSFFFWLLPSNFLIDGIRPTTDSLWQISKLLFVSILIYSIIEYFIFGRKFHNFIFAKTATLFLAPITYIIASYYLDMNLGDATFNNHIIAYALAIFIGQYASYYLLRHKLYFKLMNTYAIIGIVLMMSFFIGYGRQTDKFEAPIFKPMKNYQMFIKNQQ